MTSDSNYNQLATIITKQLDPSQKNGIVIFLNGPWGSGKTHFWKHVVAPKLNSSAYIYVSLFGVGGVNDLKQKMLSSILAGKQADDLMNRGKSFLGKLVQPVVNFVETQTGFKFDIDLFDLISSKKNFTVCFDDFERLPVTSSVEEVLGFINYLSEHKGFKSMIVMDETQIKEDHLKAFHLLREKLSLRTFKLELDMTNRLKMFMESFSKKYNVRLSNTENDEVLNVIDKLGTNNLRTIKFTLDCFFQLRVDIQRELPAELIKFLIAMIDFESKGSPQNDTFYKFDPLELSILERNRKKGETGQEAQPSLQAQFYGKYFSDNHPYRMYDCAFEIVRSGYFSVDKALNELFPLEKQLTSVEKLAAKIKNTHFFFSQDSELSDLEKEINTLLKSVEDMEFGTILTFAKGLSSVSRLLEKGEMTTLPDNFEDRAKEAVKKIKQTDEIPYDVGDDINGLAQIFVKALNKICNQERKNRIVSTLEDAIKSGKSRFLKEQLIENQLVLEQIFSDGLIRLIWSEALRQEDKYGLLNTIVKAMVRSSHQNAKIKAELGATHDFLIDEYKKLSSKMHRLRTYRILEETCLELPADKPKIADT